MLGNKCPFYNKCNAKNRYNNKHYCATEQSSRYCPERPMNFNNKQVADNYAYTKSNNTNATIFWVIVGIIVTITIISKIL